MQRSMDQAKDDMRANKSRVGRMALDIERIKQDSSTDDTATGHAEKDGQPEQQIT